MVRIGVGRDNPPKRVGTVRHLNLWLPKLSRTILATFQGQAIKTGADLGFETWNWRWGFKAGETVDNQLRPLYNRNKPPDTLKAQY